MLALTKEGTQMLISLITGELGQIVDIADKAYVDAADGALLQHVDDADASLRQYVDSQSQILKQSIDGNDTSIRQYVDTKETILNSAINSGDASVKEYANTQDAALETKIMNAVNAAIEKALNEKIVASKTDLVSGSSALKTGTLYCLIE